MTQDPFLHFTTSLTILNPDSRLYLNTGRNLSQLFWLCMLDGPSGMLRVNLPVLIQFTHKRTSLLRVCEKIKVTPGESKLVTALFIPQKLLPYTSPVTPK